MTHGTQYAYSRGCRCELCRDAERQARIRCGDNGGSYTRPYVEQAPTHFDADALRRAIRRQGLSICGLSRELGWEGTKLQKDLERGRANYYALDTVCTRLGLWTDDLVLEEAIA